MRNQANEIEENTEFDPFLGSKNNKKQGKIQVRLFNRITVSRWFRNQVAKAFPALGGNVAHWQMMQYLLLGACDDRETGKRLLAHEFLAEIAGHKGDKSNFKSGQFLQEFRNTHFSPSTFSWTPHLAAEKCRQVDTLILPASLLSALEEEYARRHYDTGRVYFATGHAFSIKTQRQDRAYRRGRAKEDAQTAETQEAREILAYLNNLPPHLFNRIVLLNHEAAEQVALSLPNANARKQQLEILKHIYEQPQTFYRPVIDGNTDRIFGVKRSFTALKREVRNALIDGWHKADLRSSQLAINAMLWDVPEVTEFLRARTQSIWGALYQHFDLHGDAATRAKPALKTALYATCYGMGVRKIGKNLTKDLTELGINKDGRIFLKHPLIKALLDGRRRAVARIQEDGGARTCFGKWLDTFELTIPQVLAQISQAIELKIIHAAFVVAKKTADFTITLFQHDGIAVHFTDKSKQELWRNRLNNAITKQAQCFGVETYLEWEFISDPAAIF